MLWFWLYACLSFVAYGVMPSSISLLGWIPAFLLHAGAGSILTCRDPWWTDCRGGIDRGRFNKMKDFAGFVRRGVVHAGRRGDGIHGLLRRSGEGRYCSHSIGAGWSSSGWWIEGGGSSLLDPGCSEALGCFPADVLLRTYWLRVGRTPYAAFKACLAMALHRVRRRRRSPADRGFVGGCRWIRDLFVIFIFLEGLSAKRSATCVSRWFEWFLACVVLPVLY